MQPVRVLLIDDDEDDYILTKEIFNEIPQKENYKLSWINNYEEGINAMLKSHYDIYLVDYRLGKYTGIDLLHEAIKSNVAEPIIILTGKGDSKVDHTALEIGAADYLVKDQISSYTIDRSIRYALKHTSTLKALKESETKFRIIFERSIEPFVIIDSTGTIRDINRAGLNFFNYDKPEVSKLKCGDLYRDDKDHDTFIQTMQEKGVINDFQTHLLTKNKEAKPVLISAFLQIDQHATEELYYCIIHDLSARKESSLLNNIQNSSSFDSIQKLTEEIKNPLSSINLSLAQLKADLKAEDESILLYLNILSTNFDKINKIVTNQNHNESVNLNLQEKSLFTLLENIINQIDYDANLNQVNIFRDFSAKDSLVKIDEEKFSNSIHAILQYLIKYGSNNITISSFPQGNNAIIEINDDGPGLSKEDQLNLFNNSFGELSKAKSTMINHNGKFEVESTLSEGCNFLISLPINN